MSPVARTLWLALLAVSAVSLVSGRRLQRASVPPPSPPQQLAVLPSSALTNDTLLDDSEGAGTVELKIINGEQAPVGQFGFMVALLQQGRFFCGGTLLDDNTVLTAAHCVVDTDLVDDPSQLTVWRVDGSQLAVAKIFPHPGYSASTIPNDNKDLTFSGPLHDLAALVLAQPVADPVTVGLPEATLAVPSGAGLQVAGWGVTENGQPSSILKYGTVAYLPRGTCPPDYDDVLCAGGTGQNTCNGDSGGPLLARNADSSAAIQLGVTSHGPDCLSGPRYAYGYYTDLRQYLPVIQSWMNGTQIAWDEGDGAAAPSSGDGTQSGLVPSDGTQAGSGIPPDVALAPPGQTDGSGFGWGQGSIDAILCRIFGCPDGSRR